MAKTDIQWTDRVWNFLRGCSMVSAGCQHCYAMKQAHRFSGPGKAYEGLTELGPDGPRWTGKIRIVEEKLSEPLHVKKPQKWFVNSMSDLFHEDIPFDFIDKAFAVMALSPQHTFQILTKRPERMLGYMNSDDAPGAEDRGEWCAEWLHSIGRSAEDIERVCAFHRWPDGKKNVLANCWLGVSVENQQTADERIPLLLQTPAAVRFVSYEPALAPINFAAIPAPGCYLDGFPDGLHWVICGGESGPKARPFDVEWARSAVEQCRAAGVACFVKQLGSRPIIASARQNHWDWGPAIGNCEARFEHFSESPAMWRVRLKDSHGGNPKEWPETLRVRQFPQWLEAVETLSAFH